MATTDRMCEFFSWLMNEDGSLSDAAKEYFQVGGTGTGGGSFLAAPSGVTATSDRTSDVRVTWGSVSAATSYSVYRGITSDTASMQLLATQSDTTPYLDTSATVGTIYFYAVVASNATLISGYSAVASGVRKSTGLQNVETGNYGETVTVPVPTGATAMEVQLWAGGNKGGGNTRDGNTFVAVGAPLNAYGGGGASGAFLRITGITVNDTQTFYLDVGGPGEPTVLYRGSVGSADRIIVNTGGAGGDATAGLPGTAGAAAASPGSTTIGGSTAAETSNGNDGEDGVTTGVGGAPTNPPAPLGGAAVSYAGFSFGKGGKGQMLNGGLSGQAGYARILFT